MKSLFILTIALLLSSNLAYANCAKGVSKQINQSGNLDESDREKMMDDCKKFQDFRLGVKNNPKGAYILNPGSFTCGKREHYVKAYNKILEQGGKYNPSVIDKYKSCRAIRTPTLTAVRTQKDPTSPIVEVVYANEYSVYYLHSQWVHGSVLVPYAELLKNRVK